MNRNGYWVEKSVHGLPLRVVRVENDVEDYEYLGNGEWEKLERPVQEIGFDDMWDFVEDAELSDVLKEFDSN